MLTVSLLKNKTYVLLAVFGLIILFLALVFIWPLLLKIKDGSNQLLSEKNNATVFRAQSDQIENFKKVQNDYNPNLEKMGSVFIDPKNPVNFIEFLETMASTSFIDPKISLLPGQPDEPMTVFQLFAAGNFLNILDFSRKIENGPYLVQIQNLSIKSVQSDSANAPSGNVNATFLIGAFIKP